MVDLHTHILPGIDDGADTPGLSVKLLEMESKNSVDTVALTPHFRMGWDNPELFLKKREELTAELRNNLRECTIELKLVQGAEVFLTPGLQQLPAIKDLCYENTEYMLMELPVEYYYDWIRKTIFELRLSGIIPVLAHVERYPYFIENPQLMSELIDMGALAQVNAGSLLYGSRRLQQFIFTALKQRLIQVMASDTHSVKNRPPQLKAAMDTIVKKLGRDTADYLCRNAEAVLESWLRKTEPHQEAAVII